MPTVQFGDRSFDCNRGVLLRDEFIDGRADPEYGPEREPGDRYRLSGLAFEATESERPGAGEPSDDETDGPDRDDPICRWTPDRPGTGD